MSKEAPFGWTVCRNNAPKARRPYKVYRRDCSADAAHHAADLAPFTRPTKAEAAALGESGSYAYKQ